MNKYITWYDIETFILREKYAGNWPDYIVGISVYPDELEIRYAGADGLTNASHTIRDWFGSKYDYKEKKYTWNHR
ncbi:MAG: hypothetical protein GY765_27680 [bacterium]|nr:hypothetical protein [bacterium]